MPARASQPRSELEGRLSAEVARIFSEFYGRGPANTRTYVLERLVFSVLYEPLTIAEEALIEAGEGDLVRDARLTFEDIMGHALVDQVERLTRRTVVGYHSQIVLDPPRALEWFLLDPGQAEPTTTGSAAPVEELHAGRPGDADAATSDAAASAAPQQRGDGADGATRAALSNAINRIVRGPDRSRRDRDPHVCARRLRRLPPRRCADHRRADARRGPPRRPRAPVARRGHGNLRA